MKIAILTHGISPSGREYAHVFAERGHEAEVFSMSAYRPEEGERVRVLAPWEFRPWESRSRLVPYVRVLWFLRRALAEFRPDVVYAIYLSSAGVLACLSGHPRVVVSAQGSDILTRRGSRLWRAVWRWQARRSCFVHAVSEPIAEVLRGAGIPLDKILVAPMGVDTARLPLIEPLKRPNAGRIICTRAHKPVYDQTTLVRALARLQARGMPFHATFFETFGVESTRALVREASLEGAVSFRPAYRLEDLPLLLAEADVYVSCSLSDGTSSSLLEAMSTGTFPVVSDIAANRPWVEHGRTGLLFPPGDDAALADRLEEALARPELRAAAAPISRAIAVEKGDLTTESGKLVAAFERCLAK